MTFRRNYWIAGFMFGLVAVLLIGCQPQIESTSTVISHSPTKVAVTSTPTDQPLTNTEFAIPFYFGVDLSYVNEMDDCGAVYLENGEARDAYALFSEHGANLVRARLWHTPDWTVYSAVPDVIRTFERAQAAGMATMLDFHYSDNWADPSKQAIPAAWSDLSDNELPNAVYQYTYDVLIQLNKNNLMPDFVQVGNETNSGMLKQVMGLDWSRDADLFNAGIRAVRDAAAETQTNPKIVLHVAQPENAGWWFREARDNGITDFDVIGLSYYPQWSAFSIADVGSHAGFLRSEFNKEVIIVETAYPWTMDAVDETADNILNKGVRAYSITVEGQRQFMIDLTQSLISNGALGVVYWEPAWVSTECTTRWGQGSHWENATFFDFQFGNEVHQGIEFLSYDYQFPSEVVDGFLEDGYGEPLLQDETGDNYDQESHLDLVSLHARDDAQFLYLGVTVAGDIFADPWGHYMIYFDTTQDGQGADIDVDKRPITVEEPHQPEYRLDIIADERMGTVSGSFAFYGWDGAEWRILAFTGGTMIHSGMPSVIELQIHKSTLGYPKALNLGVITTGRGRVHSAGDVLGTAVSIGNWKEPIVLNVFAQYEMTISE